MGKPKSRRARRQEDQQRGRSDHELVDAGGVRPSSKPKPEPTPPPNSDDEDVSGGMQSEVLNMKMLDWDLACILRGLSLAETTRVAEE
ncbi:hypothetical protein ACEPPN_014296 [Leptodophora sp. 'Broadleaf-Isolate-01']